MLLYIAVKYHHIYVNTISHYKFAVCFDIVYHSQANILLHTITGAIHDQFLEL